MAETAKMAETAEELNRELDEILELNWLAIDAHWEIEALEWTRQSQMDAKVVKLYGEYKELAPSFARKRLEEDQEYQRLVGRIEELRRLRLKQWSEVTFRMNRLIIGMVEYVVRNAPWLSASARSILEIVN
ncbi:MAG TPA: hypothetical protein VKJ45_02415 [Blastocatellia bacterium]|nr:hypothetical protein [Blastocatellia bacterium]